MAHSSDVDTICVGCTEQFDGCDWLLFDDDFDLPAQIFGLWEIR